MWQAAGRILSEHFGEHSFSDKKQLDGGEIHRSRSARYGDHPVFIKYNRRDMLQVFKTEAEQLDALSRSRTLTPPAVYGVGSTKEFSFLIMEYLPLKPFDSHSAYMFGQQLARLHQWHEQPRYGFDEDNLLGTSPQPNAWDKKWASFFAEKRIGWQLQLAKEKGIIFGDIDSIIQRVQQRLANHQPQPSLLHGDLWPSNCAAVADGGTVAFDPACYWGDRECDLAMLSFFPELPMQILDGYQQVWPLESGFLERQPLYQLYYQLHRSHLFGDRYYQSAQAIIDDILAG